MIDTSKYEGHEPGPWEYSPDSGCIFGPQNEETGNWPVLIELPKTACLIDGEWMVSKRIPNAKRGQKMFEWVRKEDYTDAFGMPQSVWWGDRVDVLPPTHRLMADAPLLLEEVKRLHVEVRALRKAQGYDMKFPVEVLVIDELMSESRQLRKENRQLRAMLESSNTVDGDD